MATVDTLILTIKADRQYSLQNKTENNKTVQEYALNEGFDIQLAEYTSTKDVKIDGKYYVFSIQDLSFKKKMYEAGEINAVIHVGAKQGKDWERPDKSVLEKLLKKKEVTLSWGTINEKSEIKAGTTICKGYYVHELSPRFMSDGMTLTLKIYSPDKVMTIGKHCNSWVSAQLAAGILKEQLANFKKPYLKKEASTTVATSDDISNQREAITDDISKLKHLKTGDREAIIPYLVQYNESFWDFLVRSTNRWGEFLYYEDGKLHIGFDSSSSKSVRIIGSTDKADYNYNSITYCDLNESPVADEDTGEVCDSVSYDAHMDRTFLEKGKYDKIKAVMGCCKDDGGDIWTTKIIGNLLSSGKNVFDYVVDTIVDEGILLGQAQTKTGKKNDDFDTKYFADSSTEDSAKKAHYLNGNIFNEFGATNTNNDESKDTCMANYMPFAATILKYVPDITPAIYKAIRQCEEKAAQNAVCIDFDTNFADLQLGQVITIDGSKTKYIVTQVNTKSVVGTKKDEKGQEVTEKYNVFEVYAIAETSQDDNSNSIFYPTPSPAGHIRFSAPQLAVVCDAGDPSRQGRVKVRYNWQLANKTTGKVPKTKSDGTLEDSDTVAGCTPWLVYAQPGGKKGTGSFYRHYEGELVLVDFADGNVERPYVVGALYTSDQTVPASTYTNNIVHVTPGGQAIKMNDGTGAGFTAWMAGMSSSIKTLQGFFPGEQLGALGFNGNESFEGSIELCDKYGMYSIKGSSDGRNITVKSPYGDIKLNAFTGITISAPNGDVKIQGKNVTIEAGNNLTLTSGKNIKNKWYTTDYGSSNAGNFGIAVLDAVTKKVASAVGGFVDVSVLRHTLEVFIRPVEGKLQVKSNRYLALEAGKGKTAYPTDAYTKPITKYSKCIREIQNDNRKIDTALAFKRVCDTFNGVSMVADLFCRKYFDNYNNCHHAVEGLKTKINDSTKNQNGNKLLPCKKWFEIVDSLWQNTSANDATLKNLIGFTGMLKEMADNEITQEVSQFFFPGFVIVGRGKRKKKVYTQSKNKIRAEQEKRRNAILQQVKLIVGYLQQLANLDVKNLLDGNGLIYDDAREVLKGMEVPFQFQAKDNRVLGRFHADYKDDEITKYTRTLRRGYFVKLVDGVFKMPREKVGAIQGVGGAVPAAPELDFAYSEDDWKTYVDSIKTVYKEEKSILADVIDKTVSDAITGSMATLFDEMQDWAAFGPNKSGKILFSDGGRTKILGLEITDAKVSFLDNPEIVPSLSEAAAKNVRELMMA